MEKDARIYVAGHRGLVGSALVRNLSARGFTNLQCRTRTELDLTDSIAVHKFFEEARPEYVFLAAAMVGGIYANNTYPAEFIHQNLSIQTNVVHEAWRVNVRRLVFLGSSCIYPRDCAQPIKEEYFLSGLLEPTNKPYAIAKIAGIEMCRAYNRQYGTRFLSVMPTNLYGPGDNYDPMNSHVLPALMARVHMAKFSGQQEVSVWGTGKPRREFLYVDDLADACIFLCQTSEDTYLRLLGDPVAAGLINIGYGDDLTIKNLAEIIAKVVGYTGRIVFDPSKPDGTPRKLLECSRMQDLGWRARVSLEDGIRATYEDFMNETSTRH